MADDVRTDNPENPDGEEGQSRFGRTESTVTVLTYGVLVLAAIASFVIPASLPTVETPTIATDAAIDSSEATAIDEDKGAEPAARPRRRRATARHASESPDH